MCVQTSYSMVLQSLLHQGLTALTSSQARDGGRSSGPNGYNGVLVDLLPVDMTPVMCTETVSTYVTPKHPKEMSLHPLHLCVSCSWLSLLKCRDCLAISEPKRPTRL